MQPVIDNALKIPKINLENWSHSSYNTSKHKAFISLGGDVSQFESTDKEPEVYFIYLVTVTNLSLEEIYQKTFKTLPEAVGFLNKSYSHWEFRDSSQNTGGGCSTCSAH